MAECHNTKETSRDSFDLIDDEDVELDEEGTHTSDERTSTASIITTSSENSADESYVFSKTRKLPSSSPVENSKRLKKKLKMLSGIPKRKGKKKKKAEKPAIVNDSDSSVQQSTDCQKNLLSGVSNSKPPPSPFDVKTSKQISKSLPKYIKVGNLNKKSESTASIEKGNVPDDRIKFFKTLSMLIDIGNPSRSHESPEPEPRRTSRPTSRSHSPDRESVMISTLNELVWLSIQAWKYIGSDPFIVRKLDDAYTLVEKERKEKVFKISNEILKYRFDYGLNRGSRFLNETAPDYSLPSQSIFERCENLSEQVLMVKQAMKDIGQILSDLNNAEELYFSKKNFLENNSRLEENNEFHTRVKTLCVWTNLVSQLAYELHMFAHKLFIDNIPNLKWPFLNYMPKHFIEHSVCPMKLNAQFERIDSKNDVVEFTLGEEEKSERANCRLIHSQSILNLENSAHVPSSSTYIFRTYVERTLRKSGLKKVEALAKKNILNMESVLNKLRLILLPVEKAEKEMKLIEKEIDEENREILQRQAAKRNRDERNDFNVQINRLKAEKLKARRELIEFGEHSEEWKEMNLPSLKDFYKFCIRIPLDVIHECLRYRLEQSREQFNQNSYDKTTTSLLSINQLMNECGEILTASVDMKKYYMTMACDIVEDLDIEELDSDMENMLGEHIKYMRHYVYKIENEPNLSKYLSRLENEWYFMRTVCSSVRQGEAKAGNGYCDMVSHLLNIISIFFGKRCDDITGNLQNLLEQPSDGDPECPNMYDVIIKLCREIKDVFDETKERTARVMGLAKMLRNDLEIAAQYRIVCTASYLLDKLRETNHVKINLKSLSSDFIVLIPESMKTDKKSIVTLLRATSSLGVADSPQNKGYLIMVHCYTASDGAKVCPIWKGETMGVEADVETEICWSHLNIKGLLILTHSRQLPAVRKEVEKSLGSKCIELVLEQVACHKAVNESLVDLKKAGLKFRSSFVEYLKDIQSSFFSVQNVPSYIGLEIIIDTLKKTYNFGFDFHTDLYRLMSGKERASLSEDLIDFALEWMHLATEKCEKGRGVRPRWAHKFFEYLRFVASPDITLHLSDEKFILFKKKFNECTCHLIGEKPKDSPSPVPSKVVIPFNPSLSVPDNRRRSDTSDSIVSPVSFVSEGGSFPHHIHYESPLSTPEEYCLKRSNTILELEKKRDEDLKRKKIIGKVTGNCQRVRYDLSLRVVTFAWQRGVKIGEGRFGKVYTAVNMSSGEMMAMKEIPIKPNDHQFVKGIADELKNFEGLNHVGLIKYYGVEVHHDQMLIFMEYCQGGTLHEAAKAGLDEAAIRFYTNKIVHAVAYLHENNIVHRDIKGDNIFLTKKGLKLGDFGSAVKLREHKTRAEERNLVRGTTLPFQPPEVVKNASIEQHLRFAADVWSVGCVVIEMVTGKLPWSELNIEQEYQMIYHIATVNHMPKVPDNICNDLRKFLERCFEIDPEKRAAAEQLLDETFVKVNHDNVQIEEI